MTLDREYPIVSPYTTRRRAWVGSPDCDVVEVLRKQFHKSFRSEFGLRNISLMGIGFQLNTTLCKTGPRAS